MNPTTLHLIILLFWFWFAVNMGMIAWMMTR